MNPRIALTGANGTIGTVLRTGLKGFEIVPLDLPESDVRDPETLLRRFEGCEAVIHLAWDLKTDNWDTGRISPDNARMTFNVYQACVEAKVRRVIMASSVHADDFFGWRGEKPMNADHVPTPTSPYGANKVLMEAMGRYYATRGLEVVCIRFGAVNKNDRPTIGNWDWRKVWLSHGDCTGLVTSCLNAPGVPGRYALIYAISNNTGRIHDWSNPFGWVPKDDSSLQEIG